MWYFLFLCVFQCIASAQLTKTITKSQSVCSRKTNTIRSTTTSLTTSAWTTIASSTTAAGNGPKETLVPAPLPNGNPYDWSFLAPDSIGAMYYCPAGQSLNCDQLMVQVNASFIFPTVILEHSGFISRVQYEPNKLSIVFNNVGAYDHVKRVWNLPEADLIARDIRTPFVLATTALPQDAQRDYFLVNKVHYADAVLTVVGYGTVLDLDKAVSDMGIQWGSYTTDNSTSHPSSSLLANTDTVVTTTLISVMPAETITLTSVSTSISTTVAQTTLTGVITSTLLQTIFSMNTITKTIQDISTSTSVNSVTQTLVVVSTAPASTRISTELLSSTLTEYFTYTQSAEITTIPLTTTLLRPSLVTITISGEQVVNTEYVTVVQISTLISSQPVQISTATVVQVSTQTNQITLEIPATPITLVQTVTSLSTTLMTITQSREIISTSTSTIVSSQTVISTVTSERVVTIISTASPIFVTNLITTTLPAQTTTIVTTVTQNACGAPPPSSTVSGMPTATCGSSFDSSLDSQMGYYDFASNNGSSLNSFAPGAGITVDDLYASSPNGTRPMLTLRGLHKRGWFSWVKKAVTTVAKVVVQAAQKVPIVKQVVNNIVKAAEVVVGVVKLVTNQPVSPSISLSIPINVGPKDNSDSPWGRAYKIFECSDTCGGKDAKNKKAVDDLKKQGGLLQIIDSATGYKKDPEPGIRLYCVKCGVKGSFTASGTITVQLLEGIKNAEVSVYGGIEAGVTLGLEALAVYERDLANIRLITIGVPGFSIPKVITVGPMITLDLKATVTIEAQGQVLAGLTFGMPNFVQTINFIDKSKSKSSGWTPRVQHVFSASGSLAAVASLGLPLGVAIGIDLLDGKWSLQAGVIDTPSIDLHAEYSVSYDLENGFQSGNENCNGIDWHINLANKIEAGFLDRTYKLGEWAGPTLAKGCIGRKPNPTPVASVLALPSTSSRISSTTRVSLISSTSSISLPAPSSVSCPANNNTVFTAPKGSTFVVRCLWDFNPGSLGDTAVAASTLTLCINACENAGSSCYAISWVPDRLIGCYLKPRTYYQQWPIGVIVYSAVRLSGPPSESSSLLLASSSLSSSRAISSATSSAPASQATCNPCNAIMRNSEFTESNLASLAGWTISGSPTTNTWTTVSPGANNTLHGFTANIMRNPNGPYSSVILSQNISMQIGGNYSFGISYKYALQQPACYLNVFMDGGYILSTTSGFNPSAVGNWVDVVIPFSATKCTHVLEVACICTNYAAQTYYLDKIRFTTSSLPRDAPVCMLSRRHELMVRQNSNVTSGNMTVLADGNTTYSSHQFDEAAAAAEAGFMVVESPPSNGTGIILPSLNETLTSSKDAELQALNSTMMNGTVSAGLDNAFGSSWINLYDTTKSVQLVAGLDGNLHLTSYIEPPSADSLFVSFNSIASGDYAQRLFSYFPLSMAAYNVSRIRLVSDPKIPRGARMLSLTPLMINGRSIYVGMDTLGNPYQLAWCNMVGGPAKVFLIGDPDIGPANLNRPDLRWTITGGVATNCSILMLTSDETGFNVGAASVAPSSPSATP